MSVHGEIEETPASPRVPDGSAGAGLSARHREWIAACLFLLPDAVGLLVFVGAPLVLSIGLSFFEVTGFGGYSFVGLANYIRMASDTAFHRSLLVTLAYVAILVPCLYVAGLGLALLVRHPSRANGLFRSMFFLPQMVSLVVVAIVWQILLVDKIGVVPRILASAGLGDVSWLGDPSYALFTIVFVSAWFLMGFYMLIFLGGLQDIPREYYEAAKIDGAGPVARFFFITLPLIRRTSFFVLLVSTITAVCGFQTFDLVYVMTKGGPANSTRLAIYYIYEHAFRFNEFGYAAALASFLILVLLAVTVLFFGLTRGGRFADD